MDENESLPVQLNLTKIILFFSAFLFSFGVYLIVSTISEWIYFSSFYPSVPFLRFTSYGSVIFMSVFLLNAFLFPPNDSQNISERVVSRVSGLWDKFILFIAAVETLIILSAIMQITLNYVDRSYLIWFLLIFGVITSLSQTKMPIRSRSKNPSVRIKLKVLSLVERYLRNGTILDKFATGFLLKIFPSIENVFLLLLLLMIPKFGVGILIVSIVQGFLSIYAYLRPFETTKRGNYFRNYVGILNSLMILYFAYQILL